jgi:hypothetical protein
VCRFEVERISSLSMFPAMSNRPLRLLAFLGLLAGLTGCQVVHDVTVDAISDRSKPMGESYHLEVNDPTGGVDPELHNLAVSTIKDALAARGLYEVPASVRPDMVIEASYAVGHGHVKIVTERNHDILVGSSPLPNPTSKAVVVFDKTLEITARAPVPPAGTGDPRNAAQPGAELWSVKAKIVDTKQILAPYLPPLASSCIDYLGENPGRELVLPVDASHAATLLQQRPPAKAAAEVTPQNR